MVNKSELEKAKAIVEQDRKEKAAEALQATKKFVEEKLVGAERYVLTFHVQDENNQLKHYFSCHNWPVMDWKNVLQATADEAGRLSMAATAQTKI